MKVILAIGGPILLLCFSYLIVRAAYRQGKSAGQRITVEAKLRDLGLSKTSAANYRRAMQVFSNMINIQDLDGPYADTILANRVRAEINQILASYRKENEL